MKNQILFISLLCTVFSFAQDCDQLKKENAELKAKLASLIDTTNSLVIKSFNPNFKVEVTGVSGNKNEQTVNVGILISHNIVHQEVCINVGPEECKAYDEQGNLYESKSGSIGLKSCLNNGSSKLYNPSFTCEKIPTGVPLKATITFRKVLPNVGTIKKMMIKIGYKDFDGNQQYLSGEIEIDNLKINWK